MPQRDDFLDALESRRRVTRRRSGTVTEMIEERPGTVAAYATFAALFAFVAYNAVWAQPNAHGNAFYSTRDHVAAQPPVNSDQTSALAPRPAARPVQGPVRAPDPTVLGVQATLKGLGLYDGALDGLQGSQTREAIIAYQTILRLPQNGKIDDVLLAQLRVVPAKRTAQAANDEAARVMQTAEGQGGVIPSVTPETVASIRPTPRPARETDGQAATVPTAAPTASAAPMPAEQGADALLLQMQAGLRLFGNPELVADGRMGPMTRKAIEEFQMITRLPVTGRAEQAVFDELRRQGFIN
jgi:peptidoglycan hydrolase-like protein with peptidoglycan-binding domain